MAISFRSYWAIAKTRYAIKWGHKSAIADWDLGSLGHQLFSNLVGNASDMLKSHKEDKQRLALDIITLVAGHSKFHCKCETYILRKIMQ